jgi:amidase
VSEAAKLAVRKSAFVPHDIRRPLKSASSGPLAGLTAVIKDMYDIEGERTGGGSPEWLLGHPPAKTNAACVQRLLDSGVEIVGKTVCDEFFFSLSGANAHYGTPENSRAPGRLPGGSSSGSAAAVGAGACDLALGSDTGGSCRIPASFCGVYGIRPTHGRTDLSGAMAMAPSFDVAGWFAASPGVFRKVGAALLAGNAERERVSQLLIASDAFAQADETVARTLRIFLECAGEVVRSSGEIAIAPRGFDEWRQCFRTVQGQEIWSIYGSWIEANQPDLGPGIRERMAYAAAVSDADYGKAKEILSRARGELRQRIPPGTILAIPTAPCIAPRLDASSTELEAFRARAMALTCIAGIGGLPQVSVPARDIEGCPIGLSFIGWPGADETLLDLAVEIGRYCGVR